MAGHRKPVIIRLRLLDEEDLPVAWAVHVNGASKASLAAKEAALKQKEDPRTHDDTHLRLFIGREIERAVDKLLAERDPEPKRWWTRLWRTLHPAPARREDAQ